MSPIPKKWKGQDGASAVEFAVILPILVLFMFGIVEFGVLFYNKQVITNASREGARYGIVSQTPRVADAGAGSITEKVDNYCASHMITFGATTPPATAVSGYDPGALFGTDLTVTVTYNYRFLVIPNILAGFASYQTAPFTITAQTVMRYE